MSTWFVEARLAWIKESVEIFGFINREHIQKKFGVSTPQASVDIREALARWPDLMSYDRSTKQYVNRTRNTWWRGYTTGASTIAVLWIAFTLFT